MIDAARSNLIMPVPADCSIRMGGRDCGGTKEFAYQYRGGDREQLWCASLSARKYHLRDKRACG
jgi:hypothetical protein